MNGSAPRTIRHHACRSLAMAALGVAVFAGCGRQFIRTEPVRASFDMMPGRGDPNVLLILALSGGGSRAAYFSTAVMFRLQKLAVTRERPGGLLQEVDAITSVSGGSVAAAAYGVSKDPGDVVSIAAELPPAAVAQLPPVVQYDADRQRLTAHGAVHVEDLKRVSAAAPEIDSVLRDLARLSQRNAAARVWDEQRLEKELKTNFIGWWILRWFYPQNFIRYWLTSFSRTDIMADVFADELFDDDVSGRNLAIKDLNPERPNIILNTTNATSSANPREIFSVFTLTQQDFAERLGRDIGDIPVGQAVMASAAFPAVFNYVNFEDRRQTVSPTSCAQTDAHYVHLFDGGNADNLGLTSAERLLWHKDQFRGFASDHIAVVIVDSYAAPTGVSACRQDPRSLASHVLVDTNFLDTFDSLLTANRKNLLAWFSETVRNRYSHWVGKEAKHQPIVCHLTWEPVDSAVGRPRLPLAEEEELERWRPQLNQIATDFRLRDDDAEYLDRAAQLLVDKNACVSDIAALLHPTAAPESSPTD